VSHNAVTKGEALENIKEATSGWLWAKDQKAASKLADADRIVVTR